MDLMIAKIIKKKKILEIRNLIFNRAKNSLEDYNNLEDYDKNYNNSLIKKLKSCKYIIELGIENNLSEEIRNIILILNIGTHHIINDNNKKYSIIGKC